MSLPPVGGMPQSPAANPLPPLKPLGAPLPLAGPPDAMPTLPTAPGAMPTLPGAEGAMPEMPQMPQMPGAAAEYAASQAAPEASYSQPLPAAPPPLPAAPAPSTWTAVQDGQGRTYYHNTATGETTWTPPAELIGGATAAAVPAPAVGGGPAPAQWNSEVEEEEAAEAGGKKGKKKEKDKAEKASKAEKKEAKAAKKEEKQEAKHAKKEEKLAAAAEAKEAKRSAKASKKNRVAPAAGFEMESEVPSVTEHESGVLSWDPSQVAAHFRAAAGLTQEYAPCFMAHGVRGRQLLALTPEEMREVGLTKVGPRLEISEQIGKLRAELRDVLLARKVFSHRAPAVTGGCLPYCCHCACLPCPGARKFAPEYECTGLGLTVTRRERQTCCALLTPCGCVDPCGPCIDTWHPLGLCACPLVHARSRQHVYFDGIAKVTPRVAPHPCACPGGCKPADMVVVSLHPAHGAEAARVASAYDAPEVRIFAPHGQGARVARALEAEVRREREAPTSEIMRR